MLPWRHFRWLIPLLAIVMRLLPGPRTIDDAYITYRYARNLLSGHGMVYNPGEPVLGTSTPLYTLIMSGAGALSGGRGADFPELSWALNAVLAALACSLLMRLGRQLQAPSAGVAGALVWAIAPMSVTFDIGGMETALTIALMLGAFSAALGHRWVLAAGLGALGLLARPDTLIYVGPLAAERLRQALPRSRLNQQQRPIGAYEILAFAAPIGVWVILSTSIYGSPLPQSITAKVAAYQLPPEAAFIRLLQHYATPFLAHLTLGNWWIGAGLLLYPILFLLGSVETLRRQVASWPLLSFPLLYLATFSLANPLIFRWYLAPPLPAYFLGIFLGVERVSRDLKLPRLGIAITLLAFALTAGGWTLSPDHGPSRPSPEMAYIELELLYEGVGRELDSRLSEGQVLAAGDIGALGYVTDARMLDTVGLVTPVAVGYYPLQASAYSINYAMSSDLILDEAPDYVVLLEVYGRNTLLQDQRIDDAYAQYRVFDTDIYGSEGMIVLQRKEAR